MHTELKLLVWCKSKDIEVDILLTLYDNTKKHLFYTYITLSYIKSKILQDIKKNTHSIP